MVADSDASFPERLRHLFERRERVSLARQGSVECAVLVPLVETSDGYGVVYTVRSEHLPNHKGQVAFPGGKRSPRQDASLRDTALREAHEEIHLRREDVEPLGELDDVYTMTTDFVITPVVGLLRAGARYRPNPAEVDALFTVSLRDLADTTLRGKLMRDWKGSSFEVPVINAGPHPIWGATHTITLNLLDCLDALSR